MDLAEVADELYGLPLGDFVSTRAERIKQAKAEGDKPLAAQIGKLPKPSTSAWVVNLLGRQAPDELAGVLDLGAALREAQENLDGDELRELSRQRQAVVAELVRRARSEATKAGQAISDFIAEEVEQTLRAAMADEHAAEVVRSHQLTSSLTAAGAGQLQSATALSGAAVRSAGRKPAPQTSKAGDAAADRAAREAAKAQGELDEARAAASEADRLATEAEAELTARQERADEAADRQEDLRAAIRELEETLRKRQEELRSADKEVTAQRRALEASERAAKASREAADAAADRLAALQT